MSHYPPAVQFVLSRKFRGYTTEVSATRADLQRRHKGSDRDTQVAKDLIEKFGFDALADRDEDDDPVPPTDEQIKIITALLLDVDNYEEELDELPPEEFLARYDLLQSGGRPRQASLERKDSRMFFNSPEARVDLPHWMMLAYWSVDEATAISLQKNPDLVNSSTMVPGTLGDGMADIEQNRLHANSPFLLEFLAQRERIQRAFDAGHFGPRINPLDFFLWEARYGRTSGLPEAKELRRVSGDPEDDGTVDWKVEYEKRTFELARLREHNRKLQTRSGEPEKTPLKSLHRLLWGIAVANFDLAPDYNGESNSRAFGNIQRELGKIGMKMDVQTIKARIREAAGTMADSEEQNHVQQRKRRLNESSAKRPGLIRR